MVTDLEGLTALCAEWQERLRLQDWRIYLTLSRARDFDNEEKAAEVTWFTTSMEAKVKILDPVDYPPTCLTPQDMEIDIVHELLHLWFAHADSEAGTGQEQAIHCISEALVKAKREGKESNG